MSTPGEAEAALSGGTSPAEQRTVRPAVVVPILMLATSLTVMAGAVVTPVVAVVRGEFELSDTQAGLVLTLHALSLALVSPIAGKLVDRYGPRAVLSAGLLCYGLAGGAGAVAPDYFALLATRVVFGGGVAAVFTATTVALLHVASGPERARVMGWRATATSAGGIAFPLLGGAVAAAGWWAPFLAYLVAVPLALVTWLTLPDTPLSRPAGARAPLGSRFPILLGLCAMFALGSVLLYAVLVFMPLRLVELGATSPFVAGVMAAVMSTTMSLTGLLFARLSRHLGPVRLLPLAYAVAAAGLFLLAAADTAGTVAIAVALFGSGLALTVPTLTLLLGDAVSHEAHGRATALSAAAIFLGQFLAPVIVGPLVESTSTKVGFVVVAAVSALAAATTAACSFRTHGSEPPARR